MWGKITEPIGNWSPYVAGANTMGSGETFVKIAWNPEFLATPLSKTTPTYGLKIECPEGGCNGLPCAIDPSKGGINGLDSPVGTNGVGGAAFCVVTVPKGKTANIVVFNTDGSEGKPAPSSKAPEPPKTTTSDKPSSTSTPPSTTSSPPTTSSAASSKPTSSAAPSTSSGVFVGGIFQEVEVQGQTSYNYSAPRTTAQPALSKTADAVVPVSTTSKNEGAAAEGGSAIAGLVVALIAAAALF